MSFSLWIAATAVVFNAGAVPAQSPSGAQPRAPQTTSRGIAALQHAAAADKYLFVFLWKENGAQTDSMWKVFQPAMSKLADRAESVAVKVSDPAEKTFVDRFGVERSPLPLVLALAPNGAITKGIPGKLTEGQLSQAFVSPGTAGCLKALQSRKLVLLCVQSRTPPAQEVAVPQGVADFAADERYTGATEIVAIDPADPAEASFLKDLQVDPRTPGDTTVFLAPPGSVIGKFDGAVTKEQLVEKLATAQSDPCAGGKCGPNGCKPRKR